jgi:HK97 gp10 family phage protein
VSQYKNIKGGAELQKFLTELPVKVERNIMRSALRAGAKPIAEDIKANAPEDEGDTKRSVRVSTRSRRGVVTASVKVGDKKAWYVHLLEFTGAVPHRIAAKGGGFLKFAGGLYKAVNHPGMKAKPFIRPALDNRANDAIQAVGNQVRKRLTKAGLNAAPVEVDDVR